MKMRWLAAGIAAVLITGGAATVAQRVITQKTRGVLPETNDAAHADSRPVVVRLEPVAVRVAAAPHPLVIPPPGDQTPAGPVSLGLAGVPADVSTPPSLPADPVGLALPDHPETQPVSPTVVVVPAEASPVGIASDLPPTTAPAADPAISPVTVQGSPEPSAASTDPVEAVDSFVERNRKEAEAAIQALSIESENLKSRLSKVDAALIRWQSFSHALTADQSPSQPDVPTATKPKWNRTPAKIPARPTVPVEAEDSPKPATEVIAGPPAAEVPSNPPVPSSPESPAPTSVEPSPEVRPASEPPPGLPEPKV